MSSDKELDFIDLVLAREAKVTEKAKVLYQEIQTQTHNVWMKKAVENANSDLCALIYRVAHKVTEQIFVSFITRGEMPDIDLTETEIFILEDAFTYRDLLLKMNDPRYIFEI